MCKYKEAKAAKSSRYVSSKGYLQVIGARDVRRSHEEVTGYLLAPGNKYEDVVSYFLGLKVGIELWNFCKRAVQT
jgi:hypothetical protein